VGREHESRAPSLAHGAALITLATAASRVTGFVRVVVVAAAMGTTYLANTYQTANTAPNLVFELVAAGVLTSVFVPTFVDYLVRGERAASWEVANVLTSVALVGLVGLAALLGLAAPLVMRLLTVGVEGSLLRSREIELGTTLLRLFAPQVVFYGAGMIMTAALHAHKRFGLAAAAPIFNNLVVIGVYVAYALMRGERAPTIAGVTTAEALVLGVGTTMGVVAMTLCLVPQLAGLGWRWRWRFEPSHAAVGRAARLGAWALGYAGGYQAGLVVVLLLANRVEGGVAAYQWAYTFFYVPHAVFAVAIFNVLFPAMSEHVARGDSRGYAARLRSGLEMLAFILFPVAALLAVGSGLIARAVLEFGAMTEGGAALVGRVLAAFAIGLPAYSGFLVLTRALYALGDAKTPALVNGLAVVVSSMAGAALFWVLPEPWSVPGLAAGHSAGFTVGLVVLAVALARKVPETRGELRTASVTRSLMVAGFAGAAMLVLRVLLPDTSRASVALSLLAIVACGGVIYTGAMKGLGSRELARIAGALAGVRS
jgi:putative peptidoglycan lipid II flippase